MGLHMFIAATTSSGALYNSLASAWIKESRYPRQVARIGVAGSAVAGDIIFDLYFGERHVAKLYPGSVGAVYPDDDDMFVLSGGEICPPGVEIRLIASASSTTNSVYAIIETKERPELIGMFRGR
jgi:hypothetical protein